MQLTMKRRIRRQAQPIPADKKRGSQGPGAPAPIPISMGGYMQTGKAQREDTTIEWNPSVITEQKSTTGISLCDLYGVPVFDDRSQEKIQSLENEKIHNIKYIGQQVFVTTSDDEERLDVIRSLVFSETAENTGSKTEKEVSGAGPDGLFWIEIFVAAALAAGYLYAGKLKRERKRRVDNINDMYGGQ